MKNLGNIHVNAFVYVLEILPPFGRLNDKRGKIRAKKEVDVHFGTPTYSLKPLHQPTQISSQLARHLLLLPLAGMPLGSKSQVACLMAHVETIHVGITF